MVAADAGRRRSAACVRERRQRPAAGRGPRPDPRHRRRGDRAPATAASCSPTSPPAPIPWRPTCRGSWSSASTAVAVAAGRAVEVLIELLPAPMALDEIVVTPSTHLAAARRAGDRRSTSTATRSSPCPTSATTSSAPSPCCPGCSGKEVSARFHVRGGRADEVLVLLDRVELFEPYHLKDYSSALSIIAPQALARGEPDHRRLPGPVRRPHERRPRHDAPSQPSAGGPTSASACSSAEAGSSGIVRRRPRPVARRRCGGGSARPGPRAFSARRATRATGTPSARSRSSSAGRSASAPTRSTSDDRLASRTSIRTTTRTTAPATAAPTCGSPTRRSSAPACSSTPWPPSAGSTATAGRIETSSTRSEERGRLHPDRPPASSTSPASSRTGTTELRKSGRDERSATTCGGASTSAGSRPTTTTSTARVLDDPLEEVRACRGPARRLFREHLPRRAVRALYLSDRLRPSRPLTARARPALRRAHPDRRPRPEPAGQPGGYALGRRRASCAPPGATSTRASGPTSSRSRTARPSSSPPSAPSTGCSASSTASPRGADRAARRALPAQVTNPRPRYENLFEPIEHRFPRSSPTACGSRPRASDVLRSRALPPRPRGQRSTGG